MKDSSKDQNLLNNDFVHFWLDRHWQIYSLTDDRRIKSFYYLYTTLVILAILWFTKTDLFKFPLLDLEISRFTAFSIAPLFILLLTIRYIYLSSHSIRAYTKYLEEFEKLYSSDLKVSKLDFIDIYSGQRRREVSELFNIFLFPFKATEYREEEFKKNVFRNISYLFNASVLLIFSIPFISYVFLIYVFTKEFQNHDISQLFGLLTVGIYVVFGILLFYSVFHLFNRTASAKNKLKSKIIKAAQESFKTKNVLD